jgi:transposase InsO family protein
MPWEQTSAMDQRIQFIADWLSEEYSKMELCAAYGISRPTADKWIKRYQQGGTEALKEISRAPHCHPNQTPQAIRQMLIQSKLSHRSWGPKKVVDYLRQSKPALRWPADSTTGEILKGAGLVERRRRRRRVSPYSEPFSECQAPNQSWSADFKGNFVMGNGRRCYPLTLTDNFSRYLLVCRGLEHPSYQAVRPWFERAFSQYGLPYSIRTDNGAPFASLALGGISELSKWWIELGIRPERIEPGKPQQNGRHERMHRTLKHEVPPQPTLKSQQRCFDRFVTQYNDQRSHEALGRKTPSSVYRASPRRFAAKLPAIEYPSGTIVRQVRHNGEIKWHGNLIYLSQLLAQQPVGLKQIGPEQWEVRYSFHRLGVLDQRAHKIVRPEIWHGAKFNKV